MATFTQLLNQLKQVQDNIKSIVQSYNKVLTLPSSWKVKVETTLKQNNTLDVKLILLEPTGTPYTRDAVNLPSNVLKQLGVLKEKIEDWLQDRSDLSL